MSLLEQAQRELEQSEQAARSFDLRAVAGRDDQVTDGWPESTPLPDGLPPVPEFDYELLPALLRRRVEDISQRMQCPADFPAVTTMVMLSAIAGRRCAIQPKRHDDWLVVPNLWGMVVGRPGIMKTPAIEEALRPVNILQTRAMEQHAAAMVQYEAECMLREQSKRVANDKIRQALKKGRKGEAAEFAEEATQFQDQPPVCQRYKVNDPTVEKLGEILKENPAGLLLYRDELNGFFRTLDRQGHEGDRAFYLESWNGKGSYTVDRIGRGTIHIPAVCLAVLGSIQPGPLSDLVRGLRGSGDDGFVQRFQLAVWPDASRHWRNVDRRPDVAARDEVQVLAEQLVGLPVCAGADDLKEVRAFRFAEDAQELFDLWRADLEQRIRSDEEHPMMEAHLAKYRSLVPSLALLSHLAEGASVGSGSPISEDSVTRAIAWAEYLEPHARRIYAPAISPDMDAARALSVRIKAGDIGARFALRDVYRHGWSGLSTRDEAAAAVAVLIEYDWLRGQTEQTSGRTRTVYEVNPVLAKDSS